MKHLIGQSLVYLDWFLTHIPENGFGFMVRVVEEAGREGGRIHYVSCHWVNRKNSFYVCGLNECGKVANIRSTIKSEIRFTPSVYCCIPSHMRRIG